MQTKVKAMIVVPLFVGSLCCVFAVISYIIVSALGIPYRLHIPIAVRACGIGVLALGFIFMGWVLKYRRPLAILQSTYLTMLKAVTGALTRETAPRTEGLILFGPQRHVRHPMYFAVLVMILGWWLVLDYTFILFMFLFFFLWFRFVVTRFEEQELRALFGEEYEAYAREVPRLFPSFKPRDR